MSLHISIKQNVKGFQVVSSPIRFKSSYSLHKIFDKKLDNSISRAKNNVFDLVLNNDFKFFVTLTLNGEHNELNLTEFRKNINSRLKYMRKKGFTDLRYILIPEKTKKGIWHFHGFFSAGFGEDMYYNSNGYLSLSSFDSLGFTSISKVNNYDACTKYILKYINKDMCAALKGQHLYFCSRGLLRSKNICSFYSSDIQPLRFDFKNNFVDKKQINYYNLITYIDTLNSYNKIYYVISDEGKLLA